MVTGPTSDENFTPADKGLRFNTGKAPIHLVDSYAVEELAKVLAFGAKKYAPHNWRKGLKITECIDSLERHVAAYKDPLDTDLDKETLLHHIAHAMCNCMFILWLQKFKPDFDDRLKLPGTATQNAAPSAEEISNPLSLDALRIADYDLFVSRGYSYYKFSDGAEGWIKNV